MQRFPTNELGQRGEALFYVSITRFYGRERPIFRPRFLGDKWPAVDFVVELAGAGVVTPYFFVQVKTTRDGYTKKDRRLRVRVKRDGLQLWEEVSRFWAESKITNHASRFVDSKWR